VAGNSTQTKGRPVPLLWSDADCMLRLPFMCRAVGGWQGCCSAPRTGCLSQSLSTCTQKACWSKARCLPPSADTSASYAYVASSNATFVLNLTAVTAQAATTACADMGGYLVAYGSLTEQIEVEQYFWGLGILLQRYVQAAGGTKTRSRHQAELALGARRFYWMGLKTDSWPEFIYANPELLDNGMLHALPPQSPQLFCSACQTKASRQHARAHEAHLGAAAGGLPYEHWGRIYLPDGGPEPNNRAGNEFCAGANYTERYDGAWAWSDEHCLIKAPFICRLKRERRERQPLLLPLLLHASSCAY
jgi:hypothetical protein